MEATPANLQQLCILANRLSYELFGIRESCILSSAALAEALSVLGVEARSLRVRASFIPRTKIPEFMGAYSGLGATEPGFPPRERIFGNGHLVCIAAGRYLPDATLSQVNKRQPYLAAAPIVAEVSVEFFEGRGVEVDAGNRGSKVRYNIFPRPDRL
jgi:hypothetical protein